MVNSNSFYKKKIEQQNEEITTINKKLDSLVSNIDYLKFKSKIEQQNEEFGKLFKTVESLVENTNSK